MEQDLKVYRIGSFQTTLIGYLSRNSGAFCYDRDYLASSKARPISQSLPLREKPFSAAEAQPYFEGLVPEGAARVILAAQLQCRENDYVAMLEYCGLDVVGDIAITSTSIEHLPPAFYEPISPADLANHLNKPKSIAALNGASRLSLAGTQNKTGLAHMPAAPLSEGWLRPCGSAASTHILKVGSSNNVSYLEYLCCNAALLCNVAAAQTSLLELDAPVICSKRFDRRIKADNGLLSVTRLHQEDLTQAFGLTSGSKYAELESGTIGRIAHFIDEHSSNPIEDLEQLTRLICFNFLIGNCDNHLKNISLIYNEDWSEVRLAPAYDLVSTTWFPDLSRNMAMAIDGIHAIDDIKATNIQALSSVVGIPSKRLSAMCQELSENIVSAIQEASRKAPDTLDEVSWKADELVEDLLPRLETLSHI